VTGCGIGADAASWTTKVTYADHSAHEWGVRFLINFSAVTKARHVKRGPVDVVVSGQPTAVARGVLASVQVERSLLVGDSGTMQVSTSHLGYPTSQPVRCSIAKLQLNQIS
jgi:hypothetical protein